MISMVKAMQKWMFGMMLLGQKATILIFVGSHCPCADPHRLLVQSLVQQHASKKVLFHAVFSNKEETPELAKRFMKQTGWNFSWTVDKNGELQKKYQAKITPEVFLLNAGGAVVYRGAIDDSVENMGRIQHPYLKTALEQLLADKKIGPASTTPTGCYIVR